MANFDFFYGGGKTIDILTRNYSLNAIGKSTLIIDGEGKDKLKSKIDFKDFNGEVIVNYNSLNNLDNITHIFVDNCEYLEIEFINDLYIKSKNRNINVSLYGKRISNAIRCMELSDNIIKLNDFEYLRKGCGLTYYYGTMNCGKTTKLIGNLEYLNDQYNVCLMKPLSDREENYIYSRLGLRKKADFVIKPDTKILSLADNLKENNTNFILVDEAQFLTEKQINQLKLITIEYKIPVICYGLKIDFKSNSFPGSKELLKISDKILKMPGQCALCENESQFNARKINDSYVYDGSQVAIDGVNCGYDALCPTCYIKHVLKIKKNGIYTNK